MDITATAARLADDERCNMHASWNDLLTWRNEAVAFLRTLAAQPDDAAAGDQWAFDDMVKTLQDIQHGTTVAFCNTWADAVLSKHGLQNRNRT